MYSETTGMVQSVQTAEHQTAALSDALPGAADNIDGYSYGMALFSLKVNRFCGAFRNSLFANGINLLVLFGTLLLI